MKILMVTNQYPTPTKPDTNPAVLHQENGLREVGVDIDIFFLDRVEDGPLAYFQSYLPLLRRWRKHNYDLLHVQFGGVQALVGTMVARNRTILTFHGTDLHGGSPKTWRARFASTLNTWCSRQAALKAGGVIIVSSNLEPHLPKAVLPRVKIFPPGVDYWLFSPTSSREARVELNLDIDAKYILFSDISSSSVKRRDIALAVEREVQKHISEAKLLFLTRQPYWRVPLYLNAADCLLLTSDKEGSPNIVKEALAVNLPVVSVDVGDVRLRCSSVPNCQIVSREINTLSEAVLRAFHVGRKGGGRNLKRSEIDNEILCKHISLFYHQVLQKVNENEKSPV